MSQPSWLTEPMILLALGIGFQCPQSLTIVIAAGGITFCRSDGESYRVPQDDLWPYLEALVQQAQTSSAATPASDQVPPSAPTPPPPSSPPQADPLDCTSIPTPDFDLLLGNDDVAPTSPTYTSDLLFVSEPKQQATTSRSDSDPTVPDLAFDLNTAPLAVVPDLDLPIGTKVRTRTLFSRLEKTSPRTPRSAYFGCTSLMNSGA